jgi:LAO/AO transport system kinase
MQPADGQHEPNDSSFRVSPSYFAGGNRHELTVDQYRAGVLAGDFTILARALTLIESSTPRHQQMGDELLTLLPHTGNAVRIGITGVPGVGKSTFIEAFGLHLVQQGKKVAVLAVDPTSGVSGGSILGDKTRMNRLAAEPNAYIRPSPSAGTAGGVARKTRECMLLCEAAGYDVVLIETVGVGQSETMVANITDCFVGLMLPGAGDELQAIKRGLLELVDLIVVNKADGPNLVAAQTAAHQYTMVLKSLTPPLPLGEGRVSGGDSPWRGEGASSHPSPLVGEGPGVRGPAEPPTVLTCSALNGVGIDKIWSIIAERFAKTKSTGTLDERRRQQNVRWLWSTVDDRLQQAARTNPAVHAMRAELESKVTSGQITPEAAARQILGALGIF